MDVPRAIRRSRARKRRASVRRNHACGANGTCNQTDGRNHAGSMEIMDTCTPGKWRENGERANRAFLMRDPRVRYNRVTGRRGPIEHGAWITRAGADRWDPHVRLLWPCTQRKWTHCMSGFREAIRENEWRVMSARGGSRELWSVVPSGIGSRHRGRLAAESWIRDSQSRSIRTRSHRHHRESTSRSTIDWIKRGVIRHLSI